MESNHEVRPQWSSPLSYLLVTIGAVVGMGNIFQFPYLVTQYGGLFVLFYVLSELFISIPLFLGELFIGRAGKQNPVGSIGILCLRSNANPRWRRLGWFCFMIALITASYYMVSVAFPLSYFFGTTNVLLHQGLQGDYFAIHGDLSDHFILLELSFLFLLAATTIVVARGIHRGLEGISKITVPFYSALLLVLAIYMATRGHFMMTITALFSMHSNQDILTVLFAAMSFAFFKLGVGMGIMIVYGSYLPYSITLKKSTAIIICFDALICLLSYFIVYPLTLESNNSDFISSPTNHSVIHIFTNIPGGLVIAAFFFLAAVIAAWTSTIALAETVVVTLMERMHISRIAASFFLGMAAIIIGTLAVLTHTCWTNTLLFQHIQVQGIIKRITTTYLMPFSAFFIALFLGWVIPQEISASELQFKPAIYRTWQFLVKYVAPSCIAVIFLLQFR